MRYLKPLVFLLAVAILFFLPDPDRFILNAVEYAGLVLILARGLLGHYDDFTDVLEERRHRR